VAREFGALLVFDEIYTGFGRTGTIFYCQQVGVTPDLLLIGKALANGLPIGAVAGPASIVNALGSGIQTSTFSGQPLACAVASRVLEFSLANQLHVKASEAGAALQRDLRALAREHHRTSEPRGVGLMLGFDCLGSDGSPSAATAESFSRRSLGAGLVLYVGGHQGASVRITPPLIMSDNDRGQLVSRLAEVIGGLPPATSQ
jgi:4-aminobutyrate aminotransferase/(S)-3-amino-2-methylpropionate transaminase